MSTTQTTTQTPTRVRAKVTPENGVALPTTSSDGRALKAETTVAELAPVEKATIGRLRAAIPAHCFVGSWSKTMYYLGRDLSMFITLFAIGFFFIPTITSTPLRLVTWWVWGFGQGLVYTGLWQIGHEMGHGSLLPSQLACDIFGFVLHCSLMTPFFAWKATHAKHHRYNTHMEKDPNHIPARYGEDDITVTGARTGPSGEKVLSTEQELKTEHEEKSDGVEAHNIMSTASQIEELVEDAPLYVLAKLIILQIIGWPMHMAFTVSSGVTACDYRNKESTAWQPAWMVKSHYNPIGSNFRPEETFGVLLSDVGLATTVFSIYKFGTVYGFPLTFALFVQPWMWLNHWIICATFLQHTSPDLPKYEAESWTFMKSIVATMDRDFGIVGTFFFHNVVPYHVVHHLSTKIPFYHAPEATEAILPILGDSYHRKSTPKVWEYLWEYWVTYRDCRWVLPDSAENREDQALWFVDIKGKWLSEQSEENAAALRQRIIT